jgi:hypothetical protein
MTDLNGVVPEELDRLSEAEMREQLATLSPEQLQGLVEAYRNRDREFRDQVRERAIQGYLDQEWNLSRLNASLQRLELAPYEPRYTSYGTAEIELALAVEGRHDAAIQRLSAFDREPVHSALRDAVLNILGEHGGTEGISVNAVRLRTGYFDEQEER